MRLQRLKLPSGVELHFIEQGAGPPLALLHGGMGDCLAWEAQISPLAERFRVLAYSRRHSSPNSNADTSHSLEADVEDLACFLRTLQIEHASLLGSSYGALVALAFALQAPQRVTGLVLAEPPLHRWACRTPAGAELYATFMRDVWRPAGGAFARGRDGEAMRLLVDGMWGRSVFESLAPERRDLALRNTKAMRLHVQANDPFPCLSRASVGQFRTRALLVQGERTSALHQRVMDELADVMSSATREVIADAGHGSPAEQPTVFNAAVLRFLAGPSSG